MTTSTILRITLFAALATLSGCESQPFEPGNKHTAAPQPRDVFGAEEPVGQYQMLPIEVLHATLRDSLGLGDTPSPDFATLCGTFPPEQCPAGDPIAVLLDNAAQLGAPVYETADPFELSGPRLFTTGGFKVWVLASSSACGRMMTEQAVPALFPNDYLPASDTEYIDDYDPMFMVLLGRLPTDAEVARLDMLQMSAPYLNLRKRGAAVCSAVLGSMEFLGSN